MPPGKSVLFLGFYHIARVRAASNILLVQHYHKLTQVIDSAPKVSFVINALRHAF